MANRVHTFGLINTLTEVGFGKAISERLSSGETAGLLRLPLLTLFPALFSLPLLCPLRLEIHLDFCRLTLALLFDSKRFTFASFGPSVCPLVFCVTPYLMFYLRTSVHVVYSCLSAGFLSVTLFISPLSLSFSFRLFSLFLNLPPDMLLPLLNTFITRHKRRRLGTISYFVLGYFFSFTPEKIRMIFS